MTTEQRTFARRLRREQTSFEDDLWQQLRGRRLLGSKFRRQVPIANYVVDFFCVDARLIVELDGKQHGWQREYDGERTQALEGMGLRVIRFTNDEIRADLAGVLRRIAVALGSF